MQTFAYGTKVVLANAKLMRSSLNSGGKAGATGSAELYEGVDRKALSKPMFQSVADKLAAEMALLDVDELARQLDCSRAIAVENRKRYKNFQTAATMPAIFA